MMKALGTVRAAAIAAVVFLALAACGGSDPSGVFEGDAGTTISFNGNSAIFKNANGYGHGIELHYNHKIDGDTIRFTLDTKIVGPLGVLTGVDTEPKGAFVKQNGAIVFFVLNGEEFTKSGVELVREE